MTLNLKTCIMTIALAVASTSMAPALADDASSLSAHATFALAVEREDGTTEVLINIGTHDACQAIIENADDADGYTCVETAPLNSN